MTTGRSLRRNQLDGSLRLHECQYDPLYRRYGGGSQASSGHPGAAGGGGAYASVTNVFYLPSSVQISIAAGGNPVAGAGICDPMRTAGSMRGRAVVPHFRWMTHALACLRRPTKERSSRTPNPKPSGQFKDCDARMKRHTRHRARQSTDRRRARFHR